MPKNEYGADDDFVCTSETPWKPSIGMTFKHPDVKRTSSINPDNGVFMVECLHCGVSFRNDAVGIALSDLEEINDA